MAMSVMFSYEAEKALFEIGTWVEERNTAGAGIRFIDRFIDRIEAFAVHGATYAICNHLTLAQKGLRCVQIDDWVVAFHQTKERFDVRYIIHASGLS